MSNEQPSRPRRSGSSASPMGSTLAIVIAIAAVVVGFLILRTILRSEDDDSTTATTLPTVATIDPLTTTPVVPLPTEPATTVFTPVTTGAKVVVANSSNQNGVAGQLTTALQGKQFTTGEPTNGATKEAATKVQYIDGDPAAQAVAASVAAVMGVATIEIMPTPVLLADPTLLGDATVLVLLGNDKAGKTLAQMTGAEPDTTTPASGSTATT